ncbi:transmembrane protein 273 isoform X1 [Phacochoerus africanus]|uniref:transmembrane protein 273 isoform X1 n=1 Tax=Phacochoerus africanus TaxID=41426 RepID=UPI001FD96823|nr:transmembrane protein 273 isoform X1 [Phacochoerus africanus]
MGWGPSTLRALLLLLDVGGAQVLATGKSAGEETDIKYALIGTALGFIISAGFLALKICMIRKHLFDNDSSDLRSMNAGSSETMAQKKRAPRLNLSLSESSTAIKLCNPDLDLCPWSSTHGKCTSD